LRAFSAEAICLKPKCVVFVVMGRSPEVGLWILP
jgi:hypothetical protein